MPALQKPNERREHKAEKNRQCDRDEHLATKVKRADYDRRSDGRRDTPHGPTVPAKTRAEWLFLDIEFRRLESGWRGVELIKPAAGFPCRAGAVGGSIRRHKSPRASPELRNSVKIASVALMPIVHGLADGTLRAGGHGSPAQLWYGTTPSSAASGPVWRSFCFQVADVQAAGSKPT
jgi:hypothetical protein